MSETTNQMLTRIAAMPHTHKVVVTFKDGTVHEFTTRNLASAENYAAHMRFKGAVKTETVIL